MPAPTTAHTHWIQRCALLLILSSLLGCEQPTPTAAATQPPLPFADVPPQRSFVGTLAGSTVRLVVDDCKVYRNSQDPTRKEDWQRVLETEFYPAAYCHRQYMSVAKDLITVDIGDMAFGAGGCCATGGTYTSTDGLVWKKH